MSSDDGLSRPVRLTAEGHTEAGRPVAPGKANVNDVYTVWNASQWFDCSGSAYVSAVRQYILQ